MENIKFTNKLEEKDAIHFNLYNAFIKKKFVMVMYSFLPVLGLFGIILELTSSSVDPINLVIFGFCFLMPFLMVGLILFQAKSIYKSQNASQTQAEQEFTEDSLISTNDKGQAKFVYNELYDIRESKRYLILYVNKINAIVIPKELVGAETVKKIKSLLWEKAPEKARHLK